MYVLIRQFNLPLAGNKAFLKFPQAVADFFAIIGIELFLSGEHFGVRN
jgi:hypothetical protein